MRQIAAISIEGEFDSTIFTAEKSIERKFAEDLDAAEEVCVYAKLPRTFRIPTPVCNYSPDWAIAFYEGKVSIFSLLPKPK